MLFDEVKKIVIKIIKEVNEKEIKPEASFVKDLGADSLDMAEIVMAIEEKFNIEIPDEESEKIKTVEDMVKTIEERIRMK
ncbi:MAG: acyl carrier protein [Elusimicrobia bacterium CG_4_10_14_0_8_um_filter_37_32]|nr:MAG: acyl carrier protein [Elusimicrobia bacterium CG02_land_8_20_14_3_00_37_13]PIZ14065.1 MAG: acyl carrier protein [Elusimicrobia bacterium CG_4_10_14_0_8_um_filter_37_32]